MSNTAALKIYLHVCANWPRCLGRNKHKIDAAASICVYQDISVVSRGLIPAELARTRAHAALTMFWFDLSAGMPVDGGRFLEECDVKAGTSQCT